MSIGLGETVGLTQIASVHASDWEDLDLWVKIWTGATFLNCGDKISKKNLGPNSISTPHYLRADRQLNGILRRCPNTFFLVVSIGFSNIFCQHFTAVMKTPQFSVHFRSSIISSRTWSMTSPIFPFFPLMSNCVKSFYLLIWHLFVRDTLSLHLC